MLIRKRGQAAMEFLMTYGWAILVVLVVIGALAYFGVLNPQSFLPKKCQFSTGLVCSDHLLRTDGTGGDMSIRINNGLGNDIKIKSISFVADNNQVGCVTGASEEKTLPAGTEANFKLTADATNPATAKCANLKDFKGARIKGKLNLEYEDLQTQFKHQQAGTLLSDVETVTSLT